MRYAQRGGYTPAEQQRRERLRMEAAGRFARGEAISQIAHDLRVTEGSVRRWHRAWRDGGTAALRSRGPVSRERLSPQQWARLEAELRKGPLAHGFVNDQRWTLGRIKTRIGRLFHVGYTVEGTSKLMRLAWLVGPGPGTAGNGTRRGGGRGVEGRGVARYKSTARDLGAWICFEDEADQGLRPPKGQTRAPRGTRPIVRVRGAGGGRVSIAGWPATGPGTARICPATCGCTAAARASRRASPGPITGT
jgi:transposase